MCPKDPPICIRGQVRSRIYRSAFSAPSGAFGYLIGDWQDRIIDFALPVAALQSRRGFYDAPSQLDTHRAAADQVAVFTRRAICGTYIAFDTFPQPDTCQLIGLFIDYLREHRFALLLEQPTNGGETIWGTSVYWANDFPHDPFPYRMSRRQSIAPHHNPRRIHALWRRCLNTAPNIA